MKLIHYTRLPNFGDELSPILCEAILPSGFLDDIDQELLLAIGSILWDNLPAQSMKYVLGSGYGGYTAPPDVHDGRWNIIFVRGPHTASKLRIPAEKAICDAAILLRLTSLPDALPGTGVAFMPHCASRDRGYWSDACDLADITFIDPRGDPVETIRKIRGAKMLIAEAMHGAIVADALRVPWIAAKPLHPINRMKWNDWADSLAIKLRGASLMPSSLMEAYHAWVPSAQPWRAQKTREQAMFSPLNRSLTYLAARRLAQIARREPQLSGDGRLARAVERSAAATDIFVRSRGFGGLKTNATLISKRGVPSSANPNCDLRHEDF